MMRCVVTIVQNKRIAMPYIFGKYCLPVMREQFHGDVQLYHVFHDCHISGSAMASNKVDETHVQKVRAAIDDGMFSHAKIIKHHEINEDWPALPSFVLAATLIPKVVNADFHLWLEDDAIVYDPDCGSWAITLGSHDVGLYQNTNEKQMINTAYFLSTNEFDVRFSRMLTEFKRTLQIPQTAKGAWDNYTGRGSLIEHCAWRAARSAVYLGPNKAFRHHPHPRYTKDRAMVHAWLENTIPNITADDLALLALDFPD
jgi:hypothetical protein